jgi:PKD repeat protein
VARIDSLRDGYQTGDLSLYPEALDGKESLYEVKNNAETKLTQSLSYSGGRVIVGDTSSFPDKGIIRISGNNDKQGELIYYGSKTSNTFTNLVRGFAGSRQNQWDINSKVGNTVSAEHHNAVKDAIMKIETNLGLVQSPNPISLNGILKIQENRFLTPKPLFRAYPASGSPPLSVTFQNFSTGPLVRYFWDFGDGETSTEKNPIHKYVTEGSYSVELNVVSVLGGQAIMTKSNYVLVSNEEKQPFFYISLVNNPQPNNLSGAIVANYLNTNSGYGPTIFEFIDQTDGDIQERYWNFNSPGRLIRKLYKCSWTIISSQGKTYKITVAGKNAKDNFYGKQLSLIVGDNCYIMNINSIKYGLVDPMTQQIDEENSKHCDLNGATPIYKTEIIATIAGGSDRSLSSNGVAKIGAIENESILNYREIDPNIHVSYFIYEKQYSRPQPSVFVLYKNQVIKKAFLKKENTIEII